jgi:hypothetical protein
LGKLQFIVPGNWYWLNFLNLGLWWQNS